MTAPAPRAQWEPRILAELARTADHTGWSTHTASSIARALGWAQSSAARWVGRLVDDGTIIAHRHGSNRCGSAWRYRLAQPLAPVAVAPPPPPPPRAERARDFSRGISAYLDW